ncbi:VgrG-related protein [Amycolatopsis sp. lyj-23]|uniref:VgrG-related protein n=1 Tax=Amycolatopsis sp. lyj-23 TaxID=2789283 RepID=UPI00397BB488
MTAHYDIGDRTRVLPRVRAGGRPLPAELADRIQRVVVDTHRLWPDMFEITFLDRDLTVARSSVLSIGTAVDVSSGSVAGGREVRLITGEITAIEGSYGRVSRTVVRGYTQDHRLQRSRRSRSFRNRKDSAVVRDVVREYELPLGTIHQTRTVHAHIGQVNQTDWEFLRGRADALGYDVGVVDGKFCFTRPVDVRRGKADLALEFPIGLRAFRPRITAGNLAATTEVRVWDPAARQAKAATAPTRTASVQLPGADPATLTEPFRPRPAPEGAADPALGELGPAPRPNAFAVTTAPVGTGSGIDAAAREAVAGAAERLGSTVAEADGEAVGDPRLRAGTVVEVGGIGPAFDGRWLVTRAVHTYDVDGYATTFEVTGRQERSILGLAAGARPAPAPAIPGVVCGVVSDIGDPDGLNRVQVVLPWLSPVFVTDWAPVALAGAGAAAAAVFLPEVGDQVLVAFEFGDPRRPYVLGGLLTGKSKPDLGGKPVLTRGHTSTVAWRGLVSPNGNRLAFHDERTPGAKPTPTKGEIVLGTQRGDVALVIDQIAGTVTVKCADGGKIDVQAGRGGVVNVGGGAQLNLTAEVSIKIESRGPVEIKGNPIKLN